MYSYSNGILLWNNEYILDLQIIYYVDYFVIILILNLYYISNAFVIT